MAVPFATGAAIAAPVIGGIAGSIAGRSSRRAARAEQERQRQILEGIVVPTPEELQFLLQEFRQVGQFHPILEEYAEQLGPSAMQDIETDPRLRQAQMDALAQISETAGAGLTDSDMAQMRMMGREADATAQAEQQRIMQEMAMRGQATGGQEMAARLAAQQASTGRRAQQYDQMAMEAQRRALEAAMMGGQLGGQVRGQEFDEQARAAQASDLINQFNLQQRAGVRQRDIGQMNQAQLRNLQEQQRIADANTGLQHQQGQMGIDATLQHADLDYRKRMAQIGQSQQAAAQHQQDAGRRAQQWTQIGAGAGQIIGAFNQPKPGGAD